MRSVFQRVYPAYGLGPLQRPCAVLLLWDAARQVCAYARAGADYDQEGPLRLFCFSSAPRLLGFLGIVFKFWLRNS